MQVARLRIDEEQAGHQFATRLALLHQVQGGDAVARIPGRVQLVQAQDAAVLYMGRAATVWVPTLAEYTAQQSATVLRVLGDGAIWVDDRTGLAVSRNMQDYVRTRSQSEIKDAEEEMASLSDTMGKPFAKALEAVARQNADIQKHILDAETPVLPVKTMAARVEATRLSLAEVGRRMNRSEEAARKLWSRAILRLQQELEGPSG